jgi:hypothetical protein
MKRSGLSSDGGSMIASVGTVLAVLCASVFIRFPIPGFTAICDVQLYSSSSATFVCVEWTHVRRTTTILEVAKTVFLAIPPPTTSATEQDMLDICSFIESKGAATVVLSIPESRVGVFWPVSANKIAFRRGGMLVSWDGSELTPLSDSEVNRIRSIPMGGYDTALRDAGWHRMQSNISPNFEFRIDGMAESTETKVGNSVVRVTLSTGSNGRGKKSVTIEVDGVVECRVSE